MHEFGLHMGARVHCQNGKCGKLTQVGVHPGTWQVTDVVVSKGFLMKEARVFPVSIIDHTEPDDVHLTLRSDDIFFYSKYRSTEGRQSVPDSPQQSMNNSGQRSDKLPQVYKEKAQKDPGLNREFLTGSTLVKNSEGFVGKLCDVVVDAETNEITHVIVQQGLHFPEYLEVPIVFVETISSNSIFLSLSQEELDIFLIPANFIYNATYPS